MRRRFLPITLALLSILAHTTARPTSVPSTPPDRSHAVEYDNSLRETLRPGHLANDRANDRRSNDYQNIERQPPQQPLQQQPPQQPSQQQPPQQPPQRRKTGPKPKILTVDEKREKKRDKKQKYSRAKRAKAAALALLPLIALPPQQEPQERLKRLENAVNRPGGEYRYIAPKPQESVTSHSHPASPPSSRPSPPGASTTVEGTLWDNYFDFSRHE